MTTKAVKNGEVYVINGLKHWITGGADVAKLHLILARVEEEGEDQGIGGFIVVHEGTTKGMSATKRHRGMGLRSLPEMEVCFENLEVHESMAIRPEGGWKRGFAGIIDSYNSQRVGSAAVCLGISQGALEHAIAYSKSRHQFGRPIAEFQGLQWMMADMQVMVNAMRNFVYQAARSSVRTKAGFPEPLLAAQAKLYGSERSKKVAHDALQIHGAEGYSRDQPLERYYRDTRMFSIGGGTAQILRNTIAGENIDAHGLTGGGNTVGQPPHAALHIAPDSSNSVAFTHDMMKQNIGGARCCRTGVGPDDSVCRQGDF